MNAHRSSGVPQDGPDARADTTDDALSDWWSALGQEERYLVMDSVRLDQGDGLGPLEQHRPAGVALTSGKRPSADLVDFVRRQRDYLERFAIADNTARQDGDVMGRDIVPEGHETAKPILDDQR